jgi:hypothetical protein
MPARDPLESPTYLPGANSRIRMQFGFAHWLDLSLSLNVSGPGPNWPLE